MHVLCTHIKWDTSDTDGEIPLLPKAVVVEVEPDEDNSIDDDEILSDALSDATGFCMMGFNYRILKKPVFAIVKGKQYWDGKEWVDNKNFCKVYQQLGAVRAAYPKVGGTCAVSLTSGQLVY
jgi:hypothetical protein